MLKWLPILALFIYLDSRTNKVSANPINQLYSESLFNNIQLPKTNRSDDGSKPILYGIRGTGGSYEPQEDGTFRVAAEKRVTLILFGQQLDDSNVTFTRTPRPRHSECDTVDHTDVFTTTRITDGVYQCQVILPKHSQNFFICILDPDRRSWFHQGDEPFLQVGTKAPLLPLWGHVVAIVVLLAFSGLFSGLNLGLMALDKNDIQVIARCGTESEKRFARTIAPVRKRGNYLLCSILLGNVFVNSTLTILMDELTSGLIAIISSTLGIVIFGEIIPQAACSRHGLAVGARTIGFTYFFMALTFPLSYPISKVLDFVLGDEIGHVYDRERLMEYIKVTKTYNKLEEDEVNIISGALNLKTKTVGEVMTRLEDVFMLPLTATLDFNTVSEISKKGYSRIPVYDGERKNIVALLHAKDLAFIDPDDNTPLKTVIDFYKHQLIHTYEDETLNNLLNHFRLGKSHMAFVRKIFASEEEDPYYEITGVVTLEDVIEEILQMEIVDETDILIDNRKKQRRKGAEHQDFTDFARIGAGTGTHNISSQMALATFQYLSTAVEPFKKPIISETVLRRLIAQKIYYFVKNIKDEDSLNVKMRTLYVAGKPADYFIMILDGKAQVTVGNECLIFDAGPFTYFGTSALRLTPSELPCPPAAATTRPPTPDSPNFGSMDIRNALEANIKSASQQGEPSGVTYKPDYTVKIVEPTLYMKVPRNVYLAAYRASRLEQTKGFSQDEEKLKREIDTAFTNSLTSNEANNQQRDFHIAGEKEKLLLEGSLKGASPPTTPRSERRTSSPQRNHSSPNRRKISPQSPTRLSRGSTPPPDNSPQPKVTTPPFIRKPSPPPKKSTPSPTRFAYPRKNGTTRGSTSPPSSPKEESPLVRKP